MAHTRICARAFHTCSSLRLISSPASLPRTSRRPSRSRTADTYTSRHTYSTLPPSPQSPTSRPPRHAPKTTDRGPASTEDTQTDFSALNVLGAVPRPSYSVESVYDEGFTLDSGTRIRDGDGLLLVGTGAFIWRPWLASSSSTGVPSGEAALRRVNTEELGDGVRTGIQVLSEKNARSNMAGLLNKKMQFDVAPQAWGVLELVWPRPDLLIIGTGASIVPLAPAVRNHLLELGVRVDVLDSRNAASQFNLLATERGNDMIAAAMLPLMWSSSPVSRRR